MPATLFHGSDAVVEYPEIRRTKYTKDFSWGFYCTKDYQQARRWANRNRTGVINRYAYTADTSLRILKFDDISDAWLDFVSKCRSGYIHDYDIVEGPMADDTVWNFVNDYLAGTITKAAFRELARFKHPTHQISFHTIRALSCLKFEGSESLC